MSDVLKENSYPDYAELVYKTAWILCMQPSPAHLNVHLGVDIDKSYDEQVKKGNSPKLINVDGKVITDPQEAVAIFFTDTKAPQSYLCFKEDGFDAPWDSFDPPWEEYVRGRVGQV